MNKQNLSDERKKIMGMLKKAHQKSLDRNYITWGTFRRIYDLVIDQDKHSLKALKDDLKEVCECGHKRPKTIILDSNELSIAHWMVYWEQRGKLCWDCFCKPKTSKGCGKMVYSSVYPKSLVCGGDNYLCPSCQGGGS